MPLVEPGTVEPTCPTETAVQLTDVSFGCVNGPVRNIDAWYSAFGVKPGDAMYIPPEKRARIW
jgi:hypothetical protein